MSTTTCTSIRGPATHNHHVPYIISDRLVGKLLLDGLEEGNGFVFGGTPRGRHVAGGSSDGIEKW